MSFLKEKYGAARQWFAKTFLSEKHKSIKQDRDEILDAEAEFMRNIDKKTLLSKERTDNRLWKMTAVLMTTVLIIFLQNNKELADKLSVNIPQPVVNVTLDGDRKEWSHTTMNKAPASRELITRRYIKEYIEEREGFVPSKEIMDERWGQFSMIYWRTQKKHWPKVYKTLKTKARNMMKAKLIRSVIVSEPEPFQEGWWHIKATFIDKYKNSNKQPPKPTVVTIFLRGEYVNLDMPKKYEKHNEIGWVVDGDSYTVTIQEGDDEKWEK